MKEHPVLLEGDAPVHALVSELVRSDEPIAVDLEADGMWAFRSSIRVVQLATRTATFVVDPTTMSDLTALAPLFSAQAPVTIFHDVSSDARLLWESPLGAAGRIFDTQVAARFLGFTRLGLAAIAEALLGVHLDKGLQTHDWRKRPLTADHLKYLAGDVVHLHEIYDLLSARVVEADLTDAVLEETRYVVSQALASVQDFRATPAWARVKGIGGLSEAQLARVRSFANVRARIAAIHDVPETRLIANDALLWMSRHPQAVLEDPKAIRAKCSAEEREWILEAAREALKQQTLPEEERSFIPRHERDAEDRVRQRLESALTGFRAAEAAASQRDLQAVLPGHCVRDLARLRPQNTEELQNVPGFGHFRVERYGTALLALLAVES